MDIESVFSDSKWKIITELSNSPLSPTKLAEKTGTTLANISTQIRLLEALDFIEEEKLSNVAKGEPRKRYSLKKNFAYIILGTKQSAGKKMLNLDKNQSYFFNVWMLNDQKIPPLLIKIYMENENYIKDSDCIGFLGLKSDELEILLIHSKPEEGSYLNGKDLSWDQANYKIKVHLHTLENFVKGVQDKDEYFLALLKKVFIIRDRNDAVSMLKKNKSGVTAI